MQPQESPQNAQSQEASRSLVGQVLDAGKSAVQGFRDTMEPVLRDGTVMAAFRQGADEIGQALKAFPDSIQTSEIGSVLNPTAAEIARDRGVFDRDGEQPQQGQDHAATEMNRGGRSR